MAIESLMRSRVAIATGQQHWEENPLITIGLGESILAVTANDETLFTAIRHYVKHLTRSIHPDTQGAGISAAGLKRQEKIRQAFELLKNDENLAKALAEFRNLRSFETSEITQLRDNLRTVRENLSLKTNRLTELELVHNSIMKLKGQLEQQERELAQLKVASTSEAVLANERAERWRDLFVQRTRINKSLVERARQFDAYLAAQRLEFQPGLTPSPLRPYEADELAVMTYQMRSSVPSGAFRKMLNKVPDPLKKQFEDLAGKIAKRKIPATVVVGLAPRFSFSRIHPDLGCFQMVRYKKKERIIRTYRIIGSQPPDHLMNSTNVHLLGVTGFPAVRHIVPFLVPGNLLVITPSASKTLGDNDDPNDLMGVPAFKALNGKDRIFSTHSIILEAK